MDPSRERELFSETTNRWLYNDKKQRAVRYVPFNVQAFVDVGVQTAGAKTCTSLEKLKDGITNRVFALKFDNDVEFIAKIPFPVAGPKHFCTASEVATLDYLSTEHGIPVPKVRAWCSRAESTPVGTEYIMYEKIPGVELYQYDKNELPLENDPYIDILPVMRRIESRLDKTHFSQIGCIYYKEDAPESLRDRPLYAPYAPQTTNSARFCIGPTVEREFWRAGRAVLNIDRGPWKDMHSYMIALAACARAFVDAQPDPSAHDEYHRLISDYEKLVPHLTPSQVSYVLWHPDLHASNIFVTETTHPCKLTGILDWQGALVAPFHLQLCTPPAYTSEQHPFVYYSSEDVPQLHESAELLDDEEKRFAHLALRRAWRQRLHEIMVHEEDPGLAEEMYGGLGVDLKRPLTSPAIAITRGRTEGLQFIRHTFVVCRSLWAVLKGVDENGSPLEPFPLDISDVDAERIEEAWAQLVHTSSMCNGLLERLGIPLDGEGIVDADEYEAAKREAEEAKQAVLDAAPTEEERDRVAKAWPLQDSRVSLMAELCC